jgi:hypothetical protein
VVDEHLCPAGADHRLLPRDPSGVAEVDDREQAPVGVGAAVASELQRDDLAGVDQRLGEAFSSQAALIRMPVASGRAFGCVYLNRSDASETAIDANVERVTVHDVIDRRWLGAWLRPR